RLDIRRRGEDDDAPGAARAVGELRGADTADRTHADHEQRREQEEEEGRGRDDRQKVAPRNHEDSTEEGGHAADSSIASARASAAKPASTWRTIWTKASCRPGRVIDRPATPWPLAVIRASSGSTPSSSIAKCQSSPRRSAPGGRLAAMAPPASRGV